MFKHEIEFSDLDRRVGDLAGERVLAAALVVSSRLATTLHRIAPPPGFDTRALLHQVHAAWNGVRVEYHHHGTPISTKDGNHSGGEEFFETLFEAISGFASTREIEAEKLQWLVAEALELPHYYVHSTEFANRLESEHRKFFWELCSSLEDGKSVSELLLDPANHSDLLGGRVSTCTPHPQKAWMW